MSVDRGPVRKRGPAKRGQSDDGGAGAPVPVTTVRGVRLDFVVQVVNEWGTVPRRAAGEQDHGYPDFGAVTAAHGLDASQVGARMSDLRLARVADELYPVFSTGSQDGTVTTLNDVLARGAQQPRLGQDGGLIAEWAAPASEQLLASCALTLYQQLISWGDSRRLGVCGGTRCADVYADLSRTGHKRFCSLSCQNRNRVAAFRAQRRDA